MKKTLFYISIAVITLFLSSCADMTSQDWRDVEQGLNQLNCSLYQVGC
jgi:PBP1b-binding outer membrane lipoprotein LpoB|tara:strand:+ start:390 stop:533 length:144 start_codon:yes stop_codon:yes gene_type:complete